MGQALGSQRVGMVLGHYRVVEKIGAGGMGEVYRAHDEHLSRDVAIKFLPPELSSDPERRKRFRKEALSLSKLNHTNIATIFDFDTQDGIDYLVMEYVAGTTLTERVGSAGLQKREFMRLATELVGGVAGAHAAGVIHRDLKPANVRLTPDGHIKILDFGLAALLNPAADKDSTLTRTLTDSTAGTLPFMSPEQLNGEAVDERTDIYALGVVMYYMAAGALPFPQQKPGELITAILNHSPAPPSGNNSQLPHDAEQIILKCLEKDPERRYQSAKELLVDLQRAGAPSSTTQTRPKTRRWQWAVAILAMTLLAAVNLVWLYRHRIHPGPPIKSLAVLPLANLSGDPSQEYFADGMTETLIANLSKLGALKVISRTSVMRYKNANKPLPEIAHELDVDAVVEGSVARSGNRIRVTAQLIQARTDQHLWAESYDREITDVLALQADVAQAITREIGVKVTPVEANRLRTAESVNPAAHDAYLQGRYFAAKWTPADVHESMRYFQQAIQLQPSYAAPYASMAQAYFLLAQPLGDLDPGPLFQQGKASALKAIELDPTVADGHSVLASIALFGDWDWVTAEREYKRALELEPNSAISHCGYAIYLTSAGRHIEAIAEVRTCVRLDPLNLTRKALAAEVYFDAGQFEEAEKIARDVLRFDPEYQRAWLVLAWLEELQGRIPEQIAAQEKAGNFPSDAAAEMRRAFATGGRNGYLKARLDWIEKSRPNLMQIAQIYTMLGERERALDALERAYREHRGGMVLLKSLPWFTTYHSEPRFQKLMRDVGIPG